MTTKLQFDNDNLATVRDCFLLEFYSNARFIQKKRSYEYNFPDVVFFKRFGIWPNEWLKKTALFTCNLEPSQNFINWLDAYIDAFRQKNKARLRELCSLKQGENLNIDNAMRKYQALPPKPVPEFPNFFF